MRGVALIYAIEPRDPLRDPHLVDWISLATQLLTGQDVAPSVHV